MLDAEVLGRIRGLYLIYLIVSLRKVTLVLCTNDICLLDFVGRAGQVHELLEVLLALGVVLVAEVVVEFIHVNHFVMQLLLLLAGAWLTAARQIF